MAKTPVSKEKIRSTNNSKARNKGKTEIKSDDSTIAKTKNKTRNRNKTSKIACDGGSGEETKALVVVEPSSSTETAKDNVFKSPTDEYEKEKEKPSKGIKRKGKKEEVRNKGKKRIKREEVDEEDVKEKSEDALYRFPMARVRNIIKNEIPDLRISPEATFLINRASEKFLQLFCREAYACAFLDRKSYTAYHHLSSVVSKRKRLEFLSDFVPEKVKAGDALAQISEAEK